MDGKPVSEIKSDGVLDLDKDSVSVMEKITLAESEDDTRKVSERDRLTVAVGEPIVLETDIDCESAVVGVEVCVTVGVGV